MLHPGDEETFTTLLQNLDEEDKRELEQLKGVVKDPGLSEAFWQQLFKDVNVPWLTEEPDDFSKNIKYCSKDQPLQRKPSDATAYSRTEFLQFLCMIALRKLAKPPVYPDLASQFVKEGSQPHGAEQAGQASPDETAQPPQRVSRENQRAHESLDQTFKRLHRKYGRDEFMIAAHQVDEAAQGIQYQAMAKNVPAKYITIGQAAEEFQIASHTLAEWVADGLLHNVTKVEHPAKPEIGIVLVEPREVVKLKEKTGAAAEPTLITLVEAAKKYDVPYTTVRAWYQRGHLPKLGREVFGTHGGGKVLVDEKVVSRLADRRTSQRNPQSKRTE